MARQRERQRASGRTELERGAVRFEQWRRQRRRGERIPAALWATAVELATRHGVSRTARTVGVGYQQLRARIGGHGRAIAERPTVTLVEVPPPGSGGGTCVIEVTDGSGATMRIHAGSGVAVDVGSLVRIFRDRR